MRIPAMVLPVALVAAATPSSSLTAQEARSSRAPAAEVRDDRFKWFFGVQGGALFFSTQKQTQSGVPAVGAHLSVVSRRGGIQLGVEEGFGSNEPTAFLDPQSGLQQRQVIFDRIRRYGFNLTGYPIRGHFEPYLGVGFGMLQVLNPEVQGAFTSPEQAALSELEAQDRTASGFVSLLGGVQFRVGRLAAFGQYQINTAPAANHLLRGTGHSLMGGLRFSLGSAKEDIKGGGY